jgi:hypothetical protein
MAARLAPAPRAPDPVQAAKVKKVVAVVNKPKPKPFTIRSRTLIDDQYSGDIGFSPATGTDAGRTYSADMLSPEGLSLWYWRCRITQHRVDPLLQAFRMLWVPPPGWTFQDGVTPTTYDEAISNPVVVTRVVKAPAAPNALVGFLVTVTRKYKP